MKTRTTTKALKENGKRIYKVSVCGLQSLLRFTDPKYYHTGVYGWNYDAYEFDNIIIVSGYRSMPGEDVPELVRKAYERKAGRICKFSLTFEGKKRDMEELLQKFINRLEQQTA